MAVRASGSAVRLPGAPINERFSPSFVGSAPSFLRSSECASEWPVPTDQAIRSRVVTLILCSVHPFVSSLICFLFHGLSFVVRSSTRSSLPPAPSVAFVARAAFGPRYELSTTSLHPCPFWYVIRPTCDRRVRPDDSAHIPSCYFPLQFSFCLSLWDSRRRKRCSRCVVHRSSVESRSSLTPPYHDSIRSRSPDHVFHFNLCHYPSVRPFVSVHSRQAAHANYSPAVSICNIQGTARNHSSYRTSLHSAPSVL